MRMRWPFFTTQPEFVQPFAVLSATTLTLSSIGFDVDDVRMIGFPTLQGLLPIHRGGHSEAFTTQRVRHEIQQIGVVVDQ